MEQSPSETHKQMDFTHPNEGNPTTKDLVYARCLFGLWSHGHWSTGLVEKPWRRDPAWVFSNPCSWPKGCATALFFVVILCSHMGYAESWCACSIFCAVFGISFGTLLLYHIDICSRRSILAVKCHGQSFLFDQIQRAIMYAYSHGSMVWVWEAFGGFGTWRPHFLWENPGPEGASRLLAVGQCHAVRSVSAGFNLLAHLFRFSQITNNVMCLGQYGSISMLRTKGMIFVFLGKLEETPLFHRIWVTWRNVYTDPLKAAWKKETSTDILPGKIYSQKQFAKLIRPSSK